ncbi:hypothetical protein BS78_06G286600 [Paspalum vaginatum]|nr:hypothetical protein BS78_06G286600 [Paspalum vaginatum]
MIKCTYLFREVKLRIHARVLTRLYYRLIAKGMCDWEAYQEHQASIKRSFNTLRCILTSYKDRRIKSGYFYICNHKNWQHKVFVMSPLYYMPRKEAPKRVRYLLQRRQAYAPPPITNNVAPHSTHGSILARFVTSLGNTGGGRLTMMKVWLIYLFVIVILACIILFYCWL